TESFDERERIIGASGLFNPTERLQFRLDAESLDRTNGEEDLEANVELAYKLTPTVTVEGGVSFSDQSGFADDDEVGQRTDLGARVTWAPSEDRSFYIFGQGTVQTTEGREENNRIGAGASVRLTEKITVEGEVSGGSQGPGGLARLNYQSTPDNQVYLGYTLDPSRTVAGSDLTGRDRGVFVAGAKRRHNEKLSTFAENTWDLFGDRRSVTEAYGVTYTPDASWTFTGGLELGEIDDPNDENFDRRAFSLGASYDNDNGVQGGLKFEYRNEEGDGETRDRDTFLISSGVEVQIDDDWRLLTSADALVSDSDESDFRDGRYIELSFGAAYRPVLNEKINALFKVTYLNDQPGEDQVTADDESIDTAQRSLILSADALYDVNEKLTLGGKYGFRLGEVAPRGTNDFTSSTAHLFVLGADWHVVHKWDIFGEVRWLYTEETKTSERGALAGVYRHVGNNAKIGVGYEWGDVSDDVSDIDYQNSGVFLNLVAKF
ncbi:MAG: TonB-dependent receptor, partial [Pseudomonadota bacterium]